MSSEVVVPIPSEPKKNFMPVKCLLWRTCPIVSLREKDCVNKGTLACKEFIRYMKDSSGVYSGDLR
jgi:hypothetical protein